MLRSRELSLMVAAGATPMQAIRFATASAAKLLGMEDKIGTLKPGKNADLIAVTSDPLQDIGALGAMQLVVVGGDLV